MRICGLLCAEVHACDRALGPRNSKGYFACRHGPSPVVVSCEICSQEHRHHKEEEEEEEEEEFSDSY